MTIDRQIFEAQLAQLRPALHRYCARMVGSALDGEDVVQDALIRALAAFDRAPPTNSLGAWLFRIAHNSAIDWLRAPARREVAMLAEDESMTGAEEAARRLATRVAVARFLRLPPQQRGAVVLKDVLGYSNAEIADILGASVAAVKAALHRGRARLIELATTTPRPQAALRDPDELARLDAYIARFNARDFDAVRAMLADDVRFDLVAHHTGGRDAFVTYFGRYARFSGWRMISALVDGRPAAVVLYAGDAGEVVRSIVAIEWDRGQVARMRDFHHADYVLETAHIVPIGHG